MSAPFESMLILKMNPKKYMHLKLQIYTVLIVIQRMIQLVLLETDVALELYNEKGKSVHLYKYFNYE